jgi:hypothetical protein
MGLGLGAAGGTICGMKRLRCGLLCWRIWLLAVPPYLNIDNGRQFRRTGRQVPGLRVACLRRKRDLSSGAADDREGHGIGSREKDRSAILPAGAVLYLADGRAGGAVEEQTRGGVGAARADQQRSIAREIEALDDLEGLHLRNNHFRNRCHRGDGRRQDRADTDEQTEHFCRLNHFETLRWNRFVGIWSLKVKRLRLLWRGEER